MTTSDKTKRARAIWTGVSGLLLGLALTINAYGQSPSTSTSDTLSGLAATAYVIKFKVKPGKNADFEKAIGEMMTEVRAKESGNIYCDLLHLSNDPQAYVIVERYKNGEASKEHSESAHIKKLGAALSNGLLEGPPERQELVFIRSK
ncbi:putative quinol monooxygenase [Dyella silvae]|uniref:putative quinol monooxygenase n=1 Tax=Dyella silvae TaxID=2994424 RepID=UPI002264D1E0|nr:putative quinol monooxygenase [Dyella silvae]